MDIIDKVTTFLGNFRKEIQTPFFDIMITGKELVIAAAAALALLILIVIIIAVRGKKKDSGDTSNAPTILLNNPIDMPYDDPYGSGYSDQSYGGYSDQSYGGYSDQSYGGYAGTDSNDTYAVPQSGNAYAPEQPYHAAPPQSDQYYPAANDATRLIGDEATGPAPRQNPAPVMGSRPDASADASDTTLVLIGKGGYFNRKRITQRGDIVIGRHPQRCTLLYPENEPGVSAVHCRVQKQGGKIWLTDLNSRHGTFINGEKLRPNEPHVLQTGDTFWLADQVNSFYIS